MALTALQGTGQAGSKRVEIEWPATQNEPSVKTDPTTNNQGALNLHLMDDSRWVDFVWLEGEGPAYTFGYTEAGEAEK